MENILFYYGGILGCYVILTAYLGSRMLIKIGKSKFFWIILLLFFNFYLFAIVLIIPKYRTKLDFKDRKKIVIFEIVYIILVTLPVVIEAFVV